MWWCEGTRRGWRERGGLKGAVRPLIKVDQEDAGSIRFQASITIRRAEDG